ncbi:MAG: ABC transporter permease [Gammaproteobacteria bacterium]|jgi:putative ABC transport system permease protein
MLRLVYRQLMLDPLRTALTCVAIAAVVAVILVLEGFNEGQMRQLRLAVLNRGADLFVVQAGIANMTVARSILPQSSRQDVEAVDGVKIAHPLTGISVIYEYEQDDRRSPMFLLVYDSGGGVEHLAEGEVPHGEREIVIDRSLAERYDLGVGDPFVLSDFEFRISGISQGAAAFFTSFGFARYDDLIDFYFESDLAADITTFPLLSFLLVDLDDGADPGAVAEEIESTVPSVDVFLPETLADKDEALGRALFGPIMRLLVTVGYVIGVLVIGIVMFAAVNARRRDFGVLKALGFSNAFLGASVLMEAMVLVTVAIPLGVALAWLIGRGIEASMPLYLILATEPVALLRTVAACMVLGVAGALAPVGLIRRVDPDIVFRS